MNNGMQDPLSALRLDDFEIYIRAKAYESKLTRTFEKFLSRAKWIPYSHRYQIFKESHMLID